MIKFPIVFSKQRRPKKRHIMVSFIVFWYICATIYVASDWAYAIYYSNEKGKESSGFVLQSTSCIDGRVGYNYWHC